MDEEIEALMDEYDIDEDTAAAAQGLMDEDGGGEAAAVELAEDL